MKMMLGCALAMGIASPALALDAPTIANVQAGPGGAGEAVLVFTNGSGRAEQAPAILPATIRNGGATTALTLRLLPTDHAEVAAGGFARLRYGFTLPVGVGGTLALSLDGNGGYEFASAGVGGDDRVASATPAAANSLPASAERLPVPPGGASPPPRADNGFLGNLSTYNPIYAVIGHGTDTDAKLEISFKYQLFGREGDPDGSWLNGFHFAYTQRMFWDLGANSAPFRDVNYQPEFLYMYALPKNEHGDQLSVRGGYLHESNGRDGSASRGYNIVYVQPQLDLPLGGWTVSVGPRIFHYVFPRTDNPDIARYRGHQALAFSIGQENGLKLSTWSRLNFSTGKGSVDADLSYPLTHLWHDLPLYLVVQGFTGYGEDLLDYDRKQSRLRVGIGIVR